MTPRERLVTTLNHQTPDRVCVDFGATFVTGIHVSVVDKLRRAVLGENDWCVKVCEPYQMLGEIDDRLRAALGIDVIGVMPRKSIFGTVEEDWKPFTLYDGTRVLVPGNFNTTIDARGDTLIYPAGDTSVPPSGRMPKGGYFFDSIIRQAPIDEDALDPADNLEDFGLFDQQDLAYFRQKVEWLDQRSDLGAILVVPGAGFGDIALVPAPFLKHPKGIRDIQEWYMSTAMRRDYVMSVFEGQCQIAMQNTQTLIDLFGDRVQAAVISGTDFGTQRGLFISRDSFCGLYKPFLSRVNQLIHEQSDWKTFIHTCGSVFELLPDILAAGFDILNPVQCSAVGMDPQRLKQQFGVQATFWGGGVDTQKTMAFGSPDEVYDEVRRRIEVFNEDGGFVFNSIHNVQGNTPIDNVLAMFKAIGDSGG